MIVGKGRALQPGERIRVLVVDDSAVIRRLVAHALTEDATIEVAGTAANGKIAMQRISQLNPDVITLDVEMPEMDGLETLRRIRREYPQVRVIMFSTLTERGAEVTLDALRLGADDYVTKASNEGSLDRSLARLRADLLPRIKQFYTASAPRLTLAPEASVPCKVRSLSPAHFLKAAAVAIGISTGGPATLAEVLPMLPGDFPLPLFVVQHMPPLFTRLLAERLNAACHLRVVEASHGEIVEPGKILIAPGDFHMKVAGSTAKAHIELEQSTPLNSCRPAVDALLTSMSTVYGGAVIAAILTGMGQDGLRGAQILKAQGAFILAQDEASSVVWGMPGAVVRGGLANRVLPAGEVASELIRLANYR